MQNNNDKSEKKKENSLLDDILKNAISSTKKHEETATGIETKTCKNCGAARPSDTNLQYCDFCETPFY